MAGNRIKYLRTSTMPKTPLGADMETDKTLSVQDAPADAKAVGDALDSIAAQFTALAPYIQKVKEWIAEEAVENFDVSSLPQYWQEDTRDALAHTISLGDDYVHHIIATDSHYTTNNNESVPIIELLQATGLYSKVIHLGDIVNGGGTGDTPSVDETKAYEMFGRFNGDLLFALGNHDNGTMKTRAYQAFLSQLDGITGTDIPTNMYYYWDDSVNKIRYFVDAYGSGSAFSFENVASLPSGWRFAILVHMHPLRVRSNLRSDSIDELHYLEGYTGTIANPDVQLTHNMKPAIISALTGHDFIGYITGHLHDDGIDTANDGLVVQATLANDGKSSNKWYPKTAGTNTSQAFTIMSISKTGNRVKFYRIGRVNRLGREFYYDYPTADYIKSANKRILGAEPDSSGYGVHAEAKAVLLFQFLPSGKTYYFYTQNPNLTVRWIVATTYQADGTYVNRYSRTAGDVAKEFNVLPFTPSGTGVEKFMVALEFDGDGLSVNDLHYTDDIDDVLPIINANSKVHQNFTTVLWADNYYWSNAGLLTESTGSAATNGYIRVTPGKTYRITVNNEAFGTHWMYANFFITPMQAANRAGSNNARSITFTVPENVYYITFSAQNLVGYTNDVVFEEVTP